MNCIPPPFLVPNRDNEHLRLLAIFHIALGCLAFLGILLVGLHFLAFTMFFNPSAFAHHWGGAMAPPPSFRILMIICYAVMALTFLAAGVLNILSGLFIRQRQHRTFSLVIAGLDCLQFPFGTILGVFTILVLTRDSVQRTYLAVLRGNAN